MTLSVSTTLHAATAATDTNGGRLHIVATLAPLASLASMVAGEHATVTTLLTSNADPHDFQLKPSQRVQLMNADLVIGVGPTLEGRIWEGSTNTRKPFRILQLQSLTTLSILQNRGFDLHTADHAHDHTQNNLHTIDPHMWLSIKNAKQIVLAITNHLIKVAPAKISVWQKNSNAAIAQLSTLEKDLQKEMQPLKKLRYIISHDGYQYFEKEYGLAPAGLVALDNEHIPSARRLNELRKQVLNTKIDCVFYEKRLGEQYVALLTENTAIKKIPLDHLGVSGVTQNQAIYPALLRQLASSFSSCQTL
ncbi:MAG: zinc ABC transporter substrate-binding protein [Gammaproteobacteria bacterium]|nr:zinc ABC transporter substrate-binding protein [Gammaproteobacteria bacterium]